MLLSHMQRFTYTATGALRWKRDVTEYADVLRNSHSPTTNAQVCAGLPFKSRGLDSALQDACNAPKKLPLADTPSSLELMPMAERRWRSLLRWSTSCWWRQTA
jgi:hypothetical protein